MNFRKMVAVASLVVMFVVSLAMAQAQRPVLYPAADGGPGSAIATGDRPLRIEFTQELPDPFANVIVVNANETGIPLEDLEKIEDMNNAKFGTPTRTSAMVVGNVGYVFVETNYEKWDLLVNTKHGGFLRRDPRPDDAESDLKEEKVVEFSHWDTLGCLAYAPPAFGGGCTSWDVVAANKGSTKGVYLKKADGAEVGLDIAIGTVVNGTPVTATSGPVTMLDAYEDFADIYSNAVALSQAESFALLEGLGTGTGVASVAEFLGNSVAGAHSYTVPVASATTIVRQVVTATGQCVAGTPAVPLNGCVGVPASGGMPGPLNTFTAGDGSTAATKGALSAEQGLNYFPKINDANTLGMHGAMQGFSPITVNGVPQPPAAGSTTPPVHNAMLFYVNAKLTGLDTEAQLAEIKGKQNKNGTYYEEIYFTFWGVY